MTGLFLATFALGACKNKTDEGILNDVVKRTDYRSVYGEIGGKVTLDMVTEKDGLVYATVDGKEYELGMDFLSMAMVYNAKPSGSFSTPEEAYNEWWRLYIQRWNYLVPEVPLYSNQYYDVYNAKIDKLETNPYWGVTEAIVSAKVRSGYTCNSAGSSLPSILMSPPPTLKTRILSVDSPDTTEYISIVFSCGKS